MLKKVIPFSKKKENELKNIYTYRKYKIHAFQETLYTNIVPSLYKYYYTIHYINKKILNIKTAFSFV